MCDLVCTTHGRDHRSCRDRGFLHRVSHVGQAGGRGWQTCVSGDELHILPEGVTNVHNMLFGK
jgi:hypothetical protein